MTAEPLGIVVMLRKNEKLLVFKYILYNLSSPKGQSTFLKSGPSGTL